MVKVEVAGLQDVIKGIEKSQEKMGKAVNATTRDFNSRAPGWISKVVTQTYAIKGGSKEIKSALKNTYTIGHANIGGVVLNNGILEFRGKVLSLAHFPFTPQEPPGLYTNKRYRMIIPGQKTTSASPVVYAAIRKKTTVRAAILKGKGKKVFTGKYPTTPFVTTMDGKNYLPFQRKTSERKSAQSIRTVSIPQMITSERTREDISKTINENVDKRLQHHIKRFNK